MNIDREKYKSQAYKFGYFVAGVILLCGVSATVALTVWFIRWLFI